MKLAIENTLGIISAEIEIEPGADSGGGWPERQRQDLAGGVCAGGAGAR